MEIVHERNFRLLIEYCLYVDDDKCSYHATRGEFIWIINNGGYLCVGNYVLYGITITNL